MSAETSSLFSVLKFIRDSGMSEHEKIVCYTLIQYLSFDGSAGDDVWPSIQTIAEGCSLSRRTVQYALDSLCEKGLLTKISTIGMPMRIRLEMSRWNNEPVQDVHTGGVQEVHTGCAGDAQGVCTTCTGVCTTCTGVCTTCTGGVQEVHTEHAERTNQQQIQQQCADPPPKKPRQKTVPVPEDIPEDWRKEIEEMRPDLDVDLFYRTFKLKNQRVRKALSTWRTTVLNWAGTEWRCTKTQPRQSRSAAFNPTKDYYDEDPF